MQRQRRVDQPGQPGRALGVADQRLDRPDDATRRAGPGLAEDLGQRLDLGQVARRGAGAVRLDVADGRRRRLPPSHRPARAPGPGPRRGRGQPLGPAVAGGAHALDHGVDPVAVALGVGQPLEHDDGDALADHDAVGRGVERPATPPRRERVRLAERQVGERVLDRVRAAQDHHVGRARLQLADRQRGRRQRRAARGVDRVVRAAQVEPVRDPARRDVQQDAGERVLGPLGQLAAAVLRAPRGRRRGSPCRAAAGTSGRRSPSRVAPRRRPARGRRPSAREGTAGRA